MGGSVLLLSVLVERFAGFSSSAILSISGFSSSAVLSVWIFFWESSSIGLYCWNVLVDFHRFVSSGGSVGLVWISSYLIFLERGAYGIS